MGRSGTVRTCIVRIPVLDGRRRFDRAVHTRAAPAGFELGSPAPRSGFAASGTRQFNHRMVFRHAQHSGKGGRGNRQD